MQVIESVKSRVIRLPIHSSTDLVAGTLVIPGVTGGTDKGTAIVNAATSVCKLTHYPPYGYLYHAKDLLHCYIPCLCLIGRLF